MCMRSSIATFRTSLVSNVKREFWRKETTAEDKDGEKKLVPVLVRADVGWVPKTPDPTSYGPKEAKGSFEPYG